jgi:prepilin-type N-terminal cleavage/methylation domain-containing protein/prepilin-type processing-associated H-X9-DG protein
VIQKAVVRMSPHNSASRRGFTLIELLVVVAIIALLVAILIPSLSNARSKSRRLLCLSNQRQIGIAIYTYAENFAGSIPYGPSPAPSFTTTNFYPCPGTVTSLISLEGGAPVGLGLMLDNQLASCKRVLFCPDADQNSLADQQLAAVGIGQAQCDYYYRHASGGSIYIDVGTGHIRLAALGLNNQGSPIRALAVDVDFLCDPHLAIFGVNTRTNHRMQTANVLFSDGHAEALDNRAGAFTVDGRLGVSSSFSKILTVFETADTR